MKTQVVRGKRLRATRVDHCGLPATGPGASLVTKGFVTTTYAPVWKDAEDLEQANADGENCVTDRTKPELKWFTVTAVFCDVDPELHTMLTANPTVLNYADDPVGFRVNKEVLSESGVALELWTGTGSSDCEVPLDDSYLTSQAASAKSYGYWLTPGVKEMTLGDVEIGASVATFTLSGITYSAPAWGRGPYDVVAADEANTPSRLLTPIGKDQHLHFERTTIAPPAITNGSVPLTLPTPYFAAVA